MRRFAIWINGEIAFARVTQALTDAGFHVRCDLNGMTVVDEVPGIVRRDEPKTNVLPIAKTKKRQ